MMKQFLRVKQIADQKFQRSEKSNVLTDELSAAEKRVDLIKESCYASGKKLSACLQRLMFDGADRRSSKKLPEASLAQCMEEWGLSLGENSVLGMTLVDYARVQEALANDLLNYKTLAEEKVVEPLQNILSVDLEKIMKFRKQLFKLTADMDSAKIRYHNALRNSQTMSGNSNSANAAKVQLLKEEAEDMTSKVDQCRDSLTAEMFNLISREPEMSELIVKLCQLQLEYHRKSFYMLESVLPDLKSQIKCCPHQRVFGVPLEDHLKVTKREIATVIETCVCWLLESAMEEEGLFRIGGSMTKIKKMKSAFDAGLQYLIEDDRDPHNVAGLLKLYLRSLPEPLLTYKFYDDWMNAALEVDHDARLRAIWSVVNSLPETHMKNLRYLMKFLSKLCQNSEVNKMSVQNIAIVIGPNLIWPQVDECALGINMTATNLHSSIIDTLITYADWFFPGECEFYVSTPTSPRHIDGLIPPSLSSSQLSLSTAKLSNGDSAVDSMSSSPTNSSPKSPSPRIIPIRPRKKAAPRAPASSKNQINRSLSVGGFQAQALARANNALLNSRHSVSHEDLLSPSITDPVFSENNNKARSTSDSVTNGHTTDPTNGKTPKTKPPRQSRNGLAPVTEKPLKHIERPSVPPPERPDSHQKNASVSSEEIFEDTDKTNELDNISFTESDTYNDCLMSLPEDTDNEEELSKMLRDTENHKVKEKSVHFCEKVIDIATFTAKGVDRSDIGVKKPSITKAPYVKSAEKPKATSDYGSAVSTPENPSSNDESSYSCHVVGGTPTWFDHYGDEKQGSSHTMWFMNSGEEGHNFYDNMVFEEEKKFRNHI